MDPKSQSLRLLAEFRYLKILPHFEGLPWDIAQACALTFLENLAFYSSFTIEERQQIYDHIYNYSLPKQNKPQ